MRYFKILTVALFATFALSAVLAGTASAALPTLLTSGGVAVTSETYKGTTTGTSTLTNLHDGGTVTCTKNVAEGTLAKNGTGYLGPFHVTFEGCEAHESGFTGPCTGEGDAAKVILVLGEIHLVYDSLSPLGAAVLFLINKLHFNCEVLGIKGLILVSGQLLCLISPLTLSTTVTITCEKKTIAGDPLDTEYWNEAGTKVEIQNGLVVQKNTEEPTMGAQQSVSTLTGTLSVELMD